MTFALSIAREFLEAMAGDVRVISDREGKSPYLSRKYLLGCPTMPDGSSPWNEHGNPHPDAVFPAGGVYLHRFHRSDVDWMHNHPWEWAVSLVLEHGYVEHRRGQESRILRPGDVNMIAHSDYHLVSLLKDDRGRERQATSLFIVGPKKKSWSFWDEVRKVEVPWREYIAASRSPEGLASLK